MSNLADSVEAKSGSFGGFIDTHRVLFDAEQLSLVRVTLPEYTNNGLGFALLSVIRYKFLDLGAFGLEGRSVGADSSRGIIVYEDMAPVIVAGSHAGLHEKSPELAQSLRRQGYSPDMISIGVLRAMDEPSANLEEIMHFMDVYRARASWIESHPVEVRFANIEVMAGGSGIDWERIFPAGPSF